MMDIVQDFDLQRARYDVEKRERWYSWLDKTPALHFDPEWDVRIIPPFGGAVARFYVDYNGNHVSVYLDTMCRLGWMVNSNREAVPYYELYPFRYDDGMVDVKRYELDHTEEMMQDIRKMLTEGTEEEE